MNLCPCQSGLEFSACCAPILAGAPAATAEALMRSRYTAFVKVDTAHLERTVTPALRAAFNADDIRRSAAQTAWLGLSIIATKAGGPEDDDGMVEFTARYRVNGGAEQVLHERSRFTRSEADGQWLYSGGKIFAAKKPGRNDPCPCGSGKKFKACCGQ